MRYGLLFAVSALLLAPASAAGVSIDRLESTGQAGGPAVARLTLSSNAAVSFTYYVQVIDLAGYTAHISWKSASLGAGEERAFETTWEPEKEGQYRVQAFVWDNNTSLAEPSSVPVNVSSSVAEHCSGAASCLAGKVTRMVDGDTLYVDNNSIRLSLVNTPERGEPGYSQAKAFTASLCPVGSNALVDEDDGQTAGSYGRMVAKVSCGEKVLNEELLEQGHAVMYESFCGKSEFAAEPWALKFGC
ncbi:MAG: thermonuclease family protein [Nitrososphaera sp.]|uniref:thermonuclease family protein n=1 Tax=Nitrososphaera sp. TaxID=1971748 RepID=UPI003D6F1C5B